MENSMETNYPTPIAKLKRFYFLTKDIRLANSIHDLRVLYSNMDWYAVSIPETEVVIFSTNVQGKYYPIERDVAFKGFKSFSDIRPETKVLRQEVDGELVAFDSEGIAMAPDSDEGKKMAVPMDEHRTECVMKAMKLIAKAVIEEEFDKRFMLLDTASTMEALTFELQYEEAKAYKEDNTSECPLLHEMSIARNVLLVDMVNMVLAGRKKYKDQVIDLMKRMNDVKYKFKIASSIRELNRLYEDYLGVAMPEQQAMEEGRVVEFERVVPVKVGFQF
jgi:hypothetical protein